ncbi:MAG: hypothetical protein ACYCO5_07800 [Acidobacteriaceae bacterium]
MAVRCFRVFWFLCPFLASPGGSACAAAQPQSGMASGPPAKAVYDPQHRSIAADVFFKTGPMVFMDVAKQTGLTSWHRMTVHFS